MCVCVCAVSYTHLDVYKRQDLIQCKRLRSTSNFCEKVYEKHLTCLQITITNCTFNDEAWWQILSTFKNWLTQFKCWVKD